METKTIYLGEDLGMGGNKIWGDAGGLQVVSQVALNGSKHLSDGILGLARGEHPMCVRGEFGSFYVGKGAQEHGRPVGGLDFERLTGAPEMKALFYGSLAKYQEKYGPFDAPLVLMVGLPFQMMMGERAKEYQDAVKKWMKGEHEFEVDGMTHRVQVAKVSMTLQSVGALYDYVLDMDGDIVPERTDAMLEEVGVISPGFNTLEMLVVKEKRSFDRFTRGNTAGVRRLLEIINRNGEWSLQELDEKIRAGRLKAELKQALPIWEREVRKEIEDAWEGTKWSRFHRVLVVGGGSILLRNELQAIFGAKAWFADEPILSTARGLWKMMK